MQHWVFDTWTTYNKVYLMHEQECYNSCYLILLGYVIFDISINEHLSYKWFFFFIKEMERENPLIFHSYIYI